MQIDRFDPLKPYVIIFKCNYPTFGWSNWRKWRGYSDRAKRDRALASKQKHEARDWWHWDKFDL